MKLVNAEQMRGIDNHAINSCHIPSLELMENAGRGIFSYIKDNLLLQFENPRIAVVCGRGNNGGDGFVVGRYLIESGYAVDFFLVGKDDKLSDDCRVNYDRIRAAGKQTTFIVKQSDLPDLSSYDLIIDAIFGTGFAGAPEGMAATVIDRINESQRIVVAVDAPSGVDVSTGEVKSSAVRADYTLTLALPKPGLFISPGRELAGTVAVIPIGIPDEAVASFGVTTNLITGEFVAGVLPTGKPDGHKGDFGKVFILAGSPGLTGAAAMSGLSAARTGAGLVTVGLPASLNSILAVKMTEVMTAPLPEVKKKSVLSLRARGEIRRRLRDCDAVAIGPGLGRHHETSELVRRLVTDLDIPAVIDADGLFSLSGGDSPLLGAHTPLILTPHPGEFARLTGIMPNENPVKNFELVAEWAQKFGSIVVLKGSPALVVSPDGQAFLNPTGNWGMATGGSGDVLTGIIVTLLGQKMPPLEAAVCGVYIHGLAGDLAIENIHPRSLLAGDLIEHLSYAFTALEEGL